MKGDAEEHLSKLFAEWSGAEPSKILPVSAHGSTREYFRIFGGGKIAIGAFNQNLRENKAFVTFSHHFKKYFLPVPEIYGENLDNSVYLEEDLGDTTLFSLLGGFQEERTFLSQRALDCYSKTVAILPRLQIVGGRDLDYSVSYPRGSFDKQSVMWDLNYFKYDFLKLSKINFDEDDLENDFLKLADFLANADRDHFLHRDFQSQNIMVVNESPYFIDYQGGRRGAIYYDIASLLNDSKANLPAEIRSQLLDQYFIEVNKIIPQDRSQFTGYYEGYSLIRLMQALGTYGFLGLYQQKPNFLKSIPFGIKNIIYFLSSFKCFSEFPVISSVFKKIVESDFLRSIN